MLKYCSVTFLASLLVLSGINSVSGYINASDKHVKARAVKLLLRNEGSCSGEQIVAPSGKTYILTAGHCKDLRGDKNSITVETEDGRTLERGIIAEDLNSDLLLLEGVPKMTGLEIADSYAPAQHVRTFTHGAGLPTYKTEGVLVGEKNVSIGLGLMESPNFKNACKGPKYSIVPSKSPDGIVSVCILSVDEMVTTAMIVPGSSGGIVADDAGQLVGVVSATDHVFGFLVTLRDIQNFVANY